MMRIMSCRENARLASLAQDGQLGLGGRMIHFLHRMMCAGCRAYARQLRKLTLLVKRRLQRTGGSLGPADGLGPEARARILAGLERQRRG
jgi:hypothetical protein